MSTGKHYFIEASKDGGYRVMAKGAKKASAVTDTQKKAIAIAKSFNPSDHPDVARVETTNAGRPPQWRSAGKSQPE